MSRINLIVKARYLRHKDTKAEKILWKELRNRKLRVKFRRQHPMEKFILDFYAPEIKLAIELDGSPHKEGHEYDRSRTEYFKSLGIKVIRFWNHEIEKDLERVIEKIKKEIN